MRYPTAPLPMQDYPVPVPVPVSLPQPLDSENGPPKPVISRGARACTVCRAAKVSTHSLTRIVHRIPSSPSPSWRAPSSLLSPVSALIARTHARMHTHSFTFSSTDEVRRRRRRRCETVSAVQTVEQRVSAPNLLRSINHSPIQITHLPLFRCIFEKHRRGRKPGSK